MRRAGFIAGRVAGAAAGAGKGSARPEIDEADIEAAIARGGELIDRRCGHIEDNAGLRRGANAETDGDQLRRGRDRGKEGRREASRQDRSQRRLYAECFADEPKHDGLLSSGRPKVPSSPAPLLKRRYE